MSPNLEGPGAEVGTIHVEGPERYSSLDVARELSAALGRDVRAEAIPEAEHVRVLTEKMGFSEAAALAFAAMTKDTHDAVSASVRDGARTDVARVVPRRSRKRMTTP